MTATKQIAFRLLLPFVSLQIDFGGLLFNWKLLCSSSFDILAI